jgi:alanyl-tRNA synthetase
MTDDERLKALREACSAAHRMQSYIEAEIAVAEARVTDPVARAEKAEAEVARLKSASVAETQRFIDEVEHHQKTADVAMRRTLKAEEEVKALRALCGEAAESLDGVFSKVFGVDANEPRYKLVMRLRGAAKGVSKKPVEEVATSLTSTGYYLRADGDKLYHSHNGIDWTEAENMLPSGGRRRVKLHGKVLVEAANGNWEEVKPCT